MSIPNTIGNLNVVSPSIVLVAVLNGVSSHILVVNVNGSVMTMSISSDSGLNMLLN